MRGGSAIIVMALVALSSAAAAAKLDQPACDSLKAEAARLESQSLKDDMAKGPEWAKANLTPERLKEIEHLIEVREGLAFRCPLPKRAAPAEAAGKKGKPEAAAADGEESPAAGAGAVPASASGADGAAAASPARPKAATAKKPVAPVKPKTSVAQPPANAPASAQ